jgi:DNA-binding transcriptional MerR regulator
MSSGKEVSVRISALSEATGVSVATIKFYLREGLLFPGERTSATQARYDGTHVSRLRLVRALIDVAGLSVAATRQVLDCLEAPSLHDALGAAQHALPPAVAADEELDLAPAREVVAARGWTAYEESMAFRQLASALRAAAEVGLPITPDHVEAYGRAAELVAQVDVDKVPSVSREEAVAYAVTGTVLYEPVLLAMRRLAQQSASARRFAEVGGEGRRAGSGQPRGRTRARPPRG